MIVVPTYHPAYLLRSSGPGSGSKGEAKFQDTVVDDLSRAIELRHRPNPWDESSIWKRRGSRFIRLFPDLQEIWTYFQRIRGQAVAVDVETSKGHGPVDCARELYTVGFAAEDGEALCVPFRKQFGQKYWGDDWTEWQVRQIVAAFLADPAGTKIFHNAPFDTVVLELNSLPVRGPIECTMHLHHCVDGELPHSLAYCVSRFVPGSRYWKDDVKSDANARSEDLPDDVFRIYNLRDCLGTVRLFKPLLAEARKVGVERLYYDTELPLVLEFAEATIRGLHLAKRATLPSRESVMKKEKTDAVNLPDILELPEGPTPFDRRDNPTLVWGWQAGLSKANPDFNRKVPFGLGARLVQRGAKALEGLRELAGNPEFNPGAGAQLRDFLYKRMGFPILARTEKSDEPSTTKEALTGLIVHALGDQNKMRALELLAVWKKCDKLVGTWTGRIQDSPPEADFKGRWTALQNGLFHVGGLPVLEDECLHPLWKLLAVTGRFTSKPGAQNWTDAVKRMFDAGPNADSLDEESLDLLAGGDLSQVELRAIAYFSGDPGLIEAYENDFNVHTINAVLLTGCRPPTGVDCNAATEAYLKALCPQIKGGVINGRQFESLPQLDDKKWKATRRLTKENVFAGNYGAEIETIYSKTTSKRDPETEKQLYPDLKIAEVQALQEVWRQMRPAIPRYWAEIVPFITRQGYWRDPLSGRIMWFRAGKDKNALINGPIQMVAASRMNERTLKYIRWFRAEVTSDRSCGVVCQVHDMLGTRVRGRIMAEKTAKGLKEIFAERFDLLGYKARFPMDDPKIGRYLDEV